MSHEARAHLQYAAIAQVLDFPAITRARAEEQRYR
jgi:hypothetical protein